MRVSLQRFRMSGSDFLARFFPGDPQLRRGVAIAAMCLCVMALTLPAWAGGGGSYDINTMLDKVLDWLSGDLAVTIGTIALVAAAFVWMFMRHERGADFAFRALLGTALAIGAGKMLKAFVGSGALL